MDLNQQVNVSEIDKILGMNNCDILVNTVILAAKEVIYTKLKTSGPLSLLQDYVIVDLLLCVVMA